jgi:hypothetical protein
LPEKFRYINRIGDRKIVKTELVKREFNNLITKLSARSKRKSFHSKKINQLIFRPACELAQDVTEGLRMRFFNERVRLYNHCVKFNPYKNIISLISSSLFR